MSTTTVSEPSTIATSLNPSAAANRYVTAHGRYRLTTITDPEALTELEADWNDLARHAADPNVFYEPWFCLPAIEHLGEGERWHWILVHHEPEKGTPVLCGLFPFVETRGPYRLPLLTLWQHDYCFLTNPLIRTGHVEGVLHGLLRHCAESRRQSLVEFPQVAADGPLQQGLVSSFRDALITSFPRDNYLRAIVRMPADADVYFKAAIGGHHFRELGRSFRKLSQLGHLEYRRMHDPSTVCHWTEWFLDLESRGWKADAGTAMQLNPAHAVFFRDAMFTGAEQGRVRFEGLFLNGEPIALKCNLMSPPASFAFKISFDESLRKHSPGVLLELESLRQLVNEPGIDWCDSCAIPDHPMINRLWTERRAIQHLQFAPRAGLGSVLLGTLPLLRSLNRLRRSWRGKPGSAEPTSKNS